MYDELVKRLQDFAAGTRRDEDAQLAFDAAEAINKLEHKEFIFKGDREGLIAQIPRWIPVTERLPKYGERVLVFGGVTMYVAYYDKNRYGGESWHKLNSKSHYCNPTHWMPLPNQPEEEA